MQSNARIFVLCHKPLTSDFPYDGSVHSTVQCGSFVNGRIGGFEVYDDSVFNSIRDLNGCFSEATGINEIANGDYVVDCEYVGFCHYRRYFPINISSISENEIICSRYCERLSMKHQYSICHPLDYYNRFVERLKSISETRGLADTIDEYMTESNEFYTANCFITTRSLMEHYFDFVRMLIPHMESIVRDGVVDTMNEYSPYQKRYASFLFERMTSFWIYNMKQRNVRIVESELKKLDIPNTENSTD